MATATSDRPVTAPHPGMQTMVSPSTRRIFGLSARLRHDLEEPERGRLLSDVRELRRALGSLEYELLSESRDNHGDAC